MGDSEDEFDRRRRDKFRGERTGDPPRSRADDREYESRGRPPAAAGGQVRSRGDYRIEAYRSGRYSPEMSPPPQKRQRADWPGGERRAGGDTAYPGGTGIPAPPVMGYSDSEGPTQPPMMTFKAFLASQDDMITDEEAIKKYTEYKLEFKRQQLNEFFLAHKEEEWFKAKYHPEECVKRQEEQLKNLQRRVEVFMEKLRAGALPALDGDNADALLYLLDSVVIRLEGGTDLDLRVLDQTEEEAAAAAGAAAAAVGAAAAAAAAAGTGENSAQQNNTAAQPAGKKADKEEAKKEEDEDLSKLPLTEEQRLLQQKAKQFLQNKTEEIKKRKYEAGSGSSSDSESGGDDAAEPAPPGADAGTAAQQPDEKEEGEEKEPPAQKADEQQEKPASAEAAGAENGTEMPRPRPLHKTSSIFLRNLAPTITKQEVEAMCRRYPGFLRAAIADPQPERRWFRRGWVTFERQVNIKEICWNLNNIRLRDCELGAIVNRDLSRRVRTVNGIASHKQVVRADIKLAAKIVQNLDVRYNLWPDPDADDQSKQPTYGVSSKNPVMRNITDYLIEEASAEEEELLGAAAASHESGDPAGADTIERDDELIKVLDRLLLYLRIVHSVDYYNHSEYPNEDEMPNRCGIVHARGMPPSSKVTPQELQDYISSFENKIGSFMQPVTRLQDDDCKRAGLNLKDPEQEVEKFVQANTQELAKDKWLCPLSNKKFKGPDFVRKHIFNKHAEKVDEVKKEVEFFNNYLRDPKRPQLPEHPSAKAPPPRKDDQGGHLHGPGYPQGAPAAGPPHHGFAGGAYGAGGGYQHQRGAPMYGGYQPAPPPPRDPYYREPYLPPRDAYPRPPRPYAAARRHVRPLNSYRDLDAPKDMDEF